MKLIRKDTAISRDLSPADRRKLADWLRTAKAVRTAKKTSNVVSPFSKRLSVRLEEALQALFEP